MKERISETSVPLHSWFITSTIKIEHKHDTPLQVK